MALEKIKPAFVGKIRDHLAAAFPGLVNNTGFSTLAITPPNGGKIVVKPSDVYCFGMPTGGTGRRPNLDIVVFQHPLGELISRGTVKAEDIVNYPDLLKGDQEYQDKQKRSLKKACVIAIQDLNGFPSFSRLYVMDGLRHRSLTASFTNVATAGKFDMDFASSAVIATKLECQIKKHIARGQGFAEARDKATGIVKDANIFLGGEMGHDVTSSRFVPGLGKHHVEVAVKRTGVMGGIAKLFGAIAAGTYRMNIEVMKEDYEMLLKSGQIDKSDILNISALRQHADTLTGEKKHDFTDTIKASPVVKIGAHTAIGTYVERYIVVPKDHPLFPEKDLVGKGLKQVMKDAGPAIAAP